MKTFQDFINDQVDEHYSYPVLWNEIVESQQMVIMELAAGKYAAYAFELGCNLTKEKCAEEAKTKEDWHRGRLVGTYIDKDSILNCESPTNPFTLK